MHYQFSMQGSRRSHDFSLLTPVRGTLYSIWLYNYLKGATIIQSMLLYVFCSYYSVALNCKLHVLPYVSTVVIGVLNLGASLVTVLLVDKVKCIVLIIDHNNKPFNMQVGCKTLIASCGLTLYVIHSTGISNSLIFV